MRETKFRAWDTKHNKWVDHAEACDFAVYGQLPDTKSIELRFPEWWEISWYTGLEDKNGVEIYEGDLAECHYCDKHLLEVYYSAGRFALKTTNGEPCANKHLVSIDNWLEVIGNVYENKELLK